jgi:hypothetical protein
MAATLVVATSIDGRGMTCRFGMHLQLLPGFYSSAAAPLEVYRCLSEKAWALLSGPLHLRIYMPVMGRVEKPKVGL